MKSQVDAAQFEEKNKKVTAENQSRLTSFNMELFPPVPKIWLAANYDPLACPPPVGKLDITNSMHWYICSSTTDFMIEIVDLKTEEYKVADLVESLMLLPIDYSPKMYLEMKDIIYKHLKLSRDLNVIHRIAEFWRQVHLQSGDCKFALKLKTEFLRLIRTVLMRQTKFDIFEQNIIHELRNIQASDLCDPNLLKLKKCLSKELEIVQEKNFEQAVALSKILLLLYPYGFISNSKLFYLLLHFSSRIDKKAKYLLIMFLQEVGEAIEFGLVSPSEKGLAQIYGRLVMISNDIQELSEVKKPDILCQKAKELLAQKKANINDLRQQPFQISEKLSTEIKRDDFPVVSKNKKSEKSQSSKSAKSKSDFPYLMQISESEILELNEELIDRFKIFMCEESTSF